MSDDVTAPLEPHDIDPSLPRVDYAEQVSVTGIHDAVLREKTEPREGLEPLPLWLITILFAAFAWGGWYLGSYSGAYRGDVFDERMGPAGAAAKRRRRRIRAAATPQDEAAAFLKLGKRQFTVNCQSCHQSTGLGRAGVYRPGRLGCPRREEARRRHRPQGPPRPLPRQGRHLQQRHASLGARAR
jgi:hypothetical protein